MHGFQEEISKRQQQRKGELRMVSDTTITIQKKEFESLIRDSERINIAKRLLKKQGFVSEIDMKALFDIEESVGETE